MDPYLEGGDFKIFWPPTPLNSVGGVVAPATPPPLLVLGPGDTINAGSTFTRTTDAAAPFRVTRDAFPGLRLFNENTSATNYGYAELATTGPTGLPAMLVGCIYEDSGAGITIPVTDRIFSDSFEAIMPGLR